MMLAQQAATTSNGTWAAVIGLATIIIGQLGKWIIDWRKDRREQEDRNKDLLLNTEIRDAVRQTEMRTTEQNGKLEKIVEVDKLQHAELIRVLQSNCRFNEIK